MNAGRPNFLIIGAQKSGTTSLADTLGKHPEVFISEPREPEYFSRNALSEDLSEETWDAYQALFRHAKESCLCGEASTGTMFHKETIDLIQNRLPKVKLIAILRKPEARAYSGLTHSIKKGRVGTNEGKELFAQEAERYLRGDDCDFDWFSRSEYGRQLEPFVNHFGDRLKVVIFEELLADQQRVLDDLLEFLELPPIRMEITKENQSRIPRGRLAEYLVAGGRRIVGPARRALGEKGYRGFREAVMKKLGKRADPLDPILAKQLRDKSYAKDIEHLETLLGRSIDCW